MSQKNEKQLPDGWRWVKLGDVCDIVNGTTPKSEIQEYWNGDIIWITPTDLGKLEHKHIFTSLRKITQQGYQSCRLELVPINTVVLSTRAPIGHLGIAKQSLCTNQGCKSFIANSSLHYEYLYLVLKNSVRAFQDLGSGTTFKEISKGQLEAFKILLPPLSEQKRIAAILNEQLEAVEKATKASEEQLKTANILSATYLRQVFESEESKNWERMRLGDVASLIQNGIYKPAEYYGTGHTFLRMYNIQNSSWDLNLDELAKVEINQNEIQQYSLKKGDLLVSRVNSFELVGKCAWVDEQAENSVFENMLIRIRLNSTVNSLFMAQQMNSSISRKAIQSVAKRAIGQASINSTDLRNLNIFLPPPSKQSEIAMTLNEQMQQVKHLKLTLQGQLDAINKLPSTLLERAFNGGL
ncbi:MAG: Type-1 restriction enzyme EcoKI specificity protein [Chroococcopsis gigantea SAG 12.99]|jgi:type I restriction enzyme S subunit|nr:restriction endonuclease subunit S [Chlorogloea purpurea SAG 13.99]MDV2999775.1 Type-1 restriction enzyme EcoKI specificity protein [Chroococcopsis gigantea SAG 12.99]